MCFTIKKTREGKQKWIALENIECYKVMNVHNKQIRSPFYNYRYRINEIVESDIDTPKFGSINKGLHSYKRITSGNLHKLHDEIVYKCIIPKGAYFYENDTEYVSNKLIVLGRVEDDKTTQLLPNKQI